MVEKPLYRIWQVHRHELVEGALWQPVRQQLGRGYSASGDEHVKVRVL